MPASSRELLYNKSEGTFPFKSDGTYPLLVRVAPSELGAWKILFEGIFLLKNSWVRVGLRPGESQDFFRRKEIFQNSSGTTWMELAELFCILLGY